MKKWECKECSAGQCKLETIEVYPRNVVMCANEANWKEVNEERIKIESSGNWEEPTQIRLVLPDPVPLEDVQIAAELSVYNGQIAKTDGSQFIGFGDKTFRKSDIPNEWLVGEPTEPKVLSAEESYRVKYSHMKNSDDEFAWSDGYVVGYEDGDKNGQLKRDLDYQPVIKDIKNYIDEMEEGGFKAHAGLLTKIIKNIPPLNKD